MNASSGSDRHEANRNKATTAAVAVALMYHALTDGGPETGLDPHYTLSNATFRGHLDRIAAAVGDAGCVRDWLAGSATARVLLTFDDGHRSDRRAAFPALLERGMRADFFVNPARVGTPGYADWFELREMAEAGMSIQSHGHEHRYLTEYSPEALRECLRAARLEIEDRVGATVRLLAPPGGRMPPGLARIARECGYSHILSSRPGRLSGGIPTILPRLAVTADIDPDRLLGWIEGRALPLLGLRLRYGLLASAKRMLGDARYERLRGLALARPGRSE